jgi:hypothetical protein
MGKSKKVRIARTLAVSDSSVIGHIGYDPVAKVLEVGVKAPPPKREKPDLRHPAAVAVDVMEEQFPTVIRYRYKHVPARVFVEIATAESAGFYFNMVVKPKYIAYRLPG